MKKLIFGNKKSIGLRDKAIINNIWKKLKDKVICPICKAKATEYYDYDIDKRLIAMNFDCNKECPNSCESALDGTGFEIPRTWFTFEGTEDNLEE